MCFMVKTVFNIMLYWQACFLANTIRFRSFHSLYSVFVQTKWHELSFAVEFKSNHTQITHNNTVDARARGLLQSTVARSTGQPAATPACSHSVHACALRTTCVPLLFPNAIERAYTHTLNSVHLWMCEENVAECVRLL